MIRILFCFLLTLLNCVNHVVYSTVCCAPDQWEGHMNLDYMQVFIDSDTLYVYYNGSISVAYDYTNSKVFYSLTGMEFSPLIPKPQRFNKTTIIHYKQNVQFDISSGKCEKSRVDQNMTQECVKEGDILQSSGKVGDGIITDTYIMSLSETFNNVRGTVVRGSCLPVHMVYIVGINNPDSGTITSLNILSTTVGIKDPSIFDPPPSCLQTSTETQEQKGMSKLQSLLTEIFHKRMLHG